jgi:hypothetical protein
MSKYDDLLEDEAVVELNQDLVEEFNDALEQTINDVCEAHEGTDPRLELLVTLGSFTAQVAKDTGYNHRDFIKFMNDMFNEVEPEDDDEDSDDEKKYHIN